MSLKNVNKIETNKVELEITVDADKFKLAVDKAFKKNSVKMNVPGFRKGKAPRSFIEKIHGEGVFYEDAINELYPEEYEKALEESNIEAIDRAEIEVVSANKEGFTFKAKVTVKPEVELGEYKGLTASKKNIAVSEEDIQNDLKRLQDRNSRIISIEDRAAQNGDITIIDFDGYVDDIAFDGGKAEKHELVLGSNSFIPGFENQIIGHSIDEEFDVNVTFPEEYQVDTLANKSAVFKVKLHEIKIKELPELDNEFVKDVSEFDTLEEFKCDISKHKQELNDKKSEDDFETSLMDIITDSMKVEIPEVMITRAVDNMVGDFEYRLQSQGMNLKSYIEYTGMDMETFRKNFNEQAERQVKARLALEKIGKIEEFEITAEEIEEEYKKIAEHYNVSIEKVKLSFDDKYVTADIKCNKAIDLIRSSAIVIEIQPNDNEENNLEETVNSDVSIEADAATTIEKPKKAIKSAKKE
jgi:trigger factor